MGSTTRSTSGSKSVIVVVLVLASASTTNSSGRSLQVLGIVLGASMHSISVLVM